MNVDPYLPVAAYYCAVGQRLTQWFQGTSLPFLSGMPFVSTKTSIILVQTQMYCLNIFSVLKQNRFRKFCWPVFT